MIADERLERLIKIARELGEVDAAGGADEQGVIDAVRTLAAEGGGGRQTEYVDEDELNGYERRLLTNTYIISRSQAKKRKRLGLDCPTCGQPVKGRRLGGKCARCERLSA